MREDMVKSETEWRAILTPERFAVTRRKETELVWSASGASSDFRS